jgi:leucyl aminopeptidase
MDVKLVGAAAAGLDADAVVLLEWDAGKRLADKVPAIYESGEVTGEFLQFTLLHGVSGFTPRRVLLAGAGKREKFDTAALRKLAGAAVRFLKGKGVRNLVFALDDGLNGAEHVEAVARGVILGSWEPDRLKSKKEQRPSEVENVTLAAENSDSTLHAALERGQALAEAENVARDIAVEPPNLLNPTVMAARARAVAEANGLEFDLLDQNLMRQMGMGALLGVAQGSAEPPALMVMRYKPQNGSGATHLGLVGKGVTFDTGGISIKPAEGMEKMKYDMAGGAAVIAAMQAVARLKPPIAVTGIVPAVENMPGGKAQRPGDIVASLSGKTIEILNTDAEGRLILADAITYAKQLGCTHLVDAATLTGAIVVALGHVSTGVFSNDDQLVERWMHAAKDAGEKMWRMPVDDDYMEQLKTVYADIQNIGGRWGGACTAAMFLKEFAGETPWIHLDIAGTAWLDDAKPWMAKGPTGLPVASFVTLALNWK